MCLQWWWNSSHDSSVLVKDSGDASLISTHKRWTWAVCVSTICAILARPRQAHMSCSAGKDSQGLASKLRPHCLLHKISSEDNTVRLNCVNVRLIKLDT